MLCAVIAGATLCLPIGRRLAAGEPPEAVTTISDAVRLGADRDESGQIRVRGTVTLAYRDSSAFAIQDESGGIWATTYRQPKAAPERAARAALQAGDMVEVAGRLDRGGYAPLILVDELHIIRHGPLPQPLAANLPRLFRGADNCRRVAVEGVVRAVRSDGRYDGLILDVDSRRILARFPHEMSREMAADLIDATVRVVGVTAAVRTSGQAFEVPQFVAGNLLLVAQEAIHNALAHADAGQIDVDAAFDAAAGTVELTVVDDGRGFLQGKESGPDQGHFGLTGMRERIERLGGTFAIESRLGGGTAVRAKVRRHDYDSRIDVTAAEAAAESPRS